MCFGCIAGCVYMCCCRCCCFCLGVQFDRMLKTVHFIVFYYVRFIVVVVIWFVPSLHFSTHIMWSLLSHFFFYQLLLLASAVKSIMQLMRAQACRLPSFNRFIFDPKQIRINMIDTHFNTPGWCSTGWICFYI